MPTTARESLGLESLSATTVYALLATPSTFYARPDFKEIKGLWRRRSWQKSQAHLSTARPTVLDAGGIHSLPSLAPAFIAVGVLPIPRYDCYTGLIRDLDV